MELILKPESADVQYHLFFTKPLMHLLYLDERFNLIENCIDTFSLRMADIVFDQSLGANSFSFKKYISNSMLDVSLGADEAKVVLRNPANVEQAAELLKLFNLLFESEEATKKIIIRRQLSSADNTEKYFSKMVSGLPTKMSNNIKSVGFNFELYYDEFNLKIKTIIEKSISLDNGVFEFFEFLFLDSTHEFDDIYKVTYDQYYQINKDLGLVVEEE